jgi:hypothetical protein
VATKIRYVGVSFDIGRIQPHSASIVLRNGFGDDAGMRPSGKPCRALVRGRMIQSSDWFHAVVCTGKKYSIASLCFEWRRKNRLTAHLWTEILRSEAATGVHCIKT